MEIIERISDLLAERDKTAHRIVQGSRYPNIYYVYMENQEERSSGSLYAGHCKFSLRFAGLSLSRSRASCCHRTAEFKSRSFPQWTKNFWIYSMNFP